LPFMMTIHLRKSLGQNLLVDNAVRDRIVAAASVTPQDIVIEIGPGKGALTSALAGRAAFLLAVEIDARFCEYLRQRLRGADNVEVRNDNFLHLNLQEEVSSLRQRFPEAKAVKIVSNLPFYITTPIVTRIVENRSVINRCVVTVQKEVAERFAAHPGSKRYGAITLFLNYHAEVEILFAIPREAFRPTPEVDGAVISITPRARPPVKVRDEKLFFRVIRATFEQRRKMLKNSLLSLGVPESEVAEALLKSGLNPRLRPERVSMDDFARLSNSLSGAAEEKIA
jgi:16S rRNA (adenine1518-N6/adenine1519-N6)-dimethyltransferase